MLLFLALMPPAHAYVVVCAPYVSATLPAPGAEFVPLDLRPLVLLDGTACGADWGFLAELLDDSGAVVASEQQDYSGSEAAPLLSLALEPEQDLAPNSVYTLRVTPSSGFGNGAELPFTTGEGYVEPLSGAAPALTLTSATRQKLDDSWLISATGVVQAEVDYSGYSSVFVFDDAGALVDLSLPDASGLASVSTFYVAPEAERELCLRAAVADGAGIFGATSEPACIHADRRMCSASPGASASGLVLLLGALVTRRRSL